MPRSVSIPDSLGALLTRFRPCFSRRGFEVFTAMFAGFILQPVQRTVCGMLTGAGLAGVWHHSRAHRFFANTRWDVREFGLILAGLVLQLLTRPDAPVLLAVDETLMRRRGPKVFAASWWHDGSAAGPTKIGYGNSWVVLAIVVTLPFGKRPVALPILFALCVKGGRSKPDLARDLLDRVAEAFPSRIIHLVGDAAYGAGQFAGLGAGITMTTRARSNAVFYRSAPPRTGKRGRPRLRGERIGTPADIAAQATEHGRWVDTRVRRYGRTLIARTTEITGLWYGVWRTDPVRVIVVNDSRRKPGAAGYDIAIVTTDLTASAADIIARYAARWSIEVCFHDAKNITGIGETQTGSTRPCNAVSPSPSCARPSLPSGSPPTRTRKRRSRDAARMHPGSLRRPTCPRSICSTPCAANSSRTALTPQPQLTPHPRKTRTCRSASAGAHHELRKSSLMTSGDL